MSDVNITELRSKILRFLAKYPNESFKSQTIAHRLSIRQKADYTILLTVLNELYQSKLISRGSRKKYSHATPSAKHHYTGIMELKKSGSGIVHLEPPDRGMIQISARFLQTALTGDKVLVAKFADLEESPSAKNLSGQMPDGEIVEVIERGNLPIVGTFQKSKHFSYVVPDDRSLGRDVYIPAGKTKNAHTGDKVVALISSWASRNLNPEGQITEVLGKSGDVRAEMAAVAREYSLPLRFSKEIITDVNSIPEQIPKEEYSRRTDIRGLSCFTIDPEDAKDFDDAVSLETTADGGYRLGVHIADVSHYVTEGSKIDREAYGRGTSVYLADAVIPMLPEKLSNNLCSLKPDEDRLTYSVFMEIDSHGEVKNHTIQKTVIHSKRRFTYEEVQKIIETHTGDYCDDIMSMHKLSRILLKKRMKEGSIDFESAEVRFRFDETGKPSEIIKKVRLDAHRLVEEFMLLANQTVARHIGSSRKEENIRPFIYRIHESPPPEKLKDFVSFVEHLGFSLNISGKLSPKAIQKLLSDVRGKDEENVINEVAIRTMAKAIYSDTNLGHFGLGFRHYTHFTSPIRRYPDLVVHRLLDEYSYKMSTSRREQIRDQLPEICEHSSEAERTAMEAERASVKIMQVEYMKRHLGDTFRAIISGVTNYGLFVELIDLLVEGLIRVRDMEDDYYTFNEQQYSLVGRKTKKRYRLGDKVMVQVARVSPEDQQIDFILID